MITMFLVFVALLFVLVLLLGLLETSGPSRAEYLSYWTYERIQNSTDEELAYWRQGRVPHQ